MIPKTIHYCWFGKKPLTELAQSCISSWRKYCPDYVIKEWNESNIDVNCNSYVREAYAAKKWAFITDYVRLKVLVEEGGIYMDTDVEVLRPLDAMLSKRAFSGFETKKNVSTGIMACEKGFPLFQQLMREYEKETFVTKNGSFNLTTNVTRITNACIKLGLKRNNSYQIINGFELFPTEYFCPKDIRTGKISCTDSTYTIHHFSGSWLSEKRKKVMEMENHLIKFLGQDRARFIVLCPFWKLFSSIYADGFSMTCRKCINKILQKS